MNPPKIVSPPGNDISINYMLGQRYIGVKAEHGWADGALAAAAGGSLRVARGRRHHVCSARKPPSAGCQPVLRPRPERASRTTIGLSLWRRQSRSYRLLRWAYSTAFGPAGKCSQYPGSWGLPGSRAGPPNSTGRGVLGSATRGQVRSQTVPIEESSGRTWAPDQRQ